MSKQLDIFIESLGTLLSPFVIDYNFILCKNIYKNTVDGYSGNWGSSLIYGNNIYNKDFVNIPYDEFVKAYFEILLNVEILNNNNPSDYKYAIIIDLMRKDISPVEELGYMIKPLYYYMEKQCST